MYVFQVASMMVERAPLHGNYMALRLMFQGAFVPKDVDTKMAIIQMRAPSSFLLVADGLQVRDQVPSSNSGLEETWQSTVFI